MPNALAHAISHASSHTFNIHLPIHAAIHPAVHVHSTTHGYILVASNLASSCATLSYFDPTSFCHTDLLHFHPIGTARLDPVTLCNCIVALNKCIDRVKTRAATVDLNAPEGNLTPCLYQPTKRTRRLFTACALYSVHPIQLHSASNADQKRSSRGSSSGAGRNVLKFATTSRAKKKNPSRSTAVKTVLL